MSVLWCLLIFLTRISAITLYCPTGKIYSVSSPFSALAAFEDQCQCQVAGSQETILSCELMIFLKYLIIFAISMTSAMRQGGDRLPATGSSITIFSRSADQVSTLSKEFVKLSCRCPCCSIGPSWNWL